ncbi:type II toxin-antitoxin system HicA family toxin [Granulicella aggregans]|uniref:type II toxin-antitoxin system HicA family toxin n=1 Tax=Granulicella aggregans TaxID=474949 RepID=UPI00160D276D
MSHWPSSKARKVYRALLRIGWVEDHVVKGSSHQQLRRPGFPEFTWAFHDTDEIGPKMLARIAKQTGLKPEDL